MGHDVYVFGDSHWRNGFPFTNHGAPGVTHTEKGITTIDTTANELSGATMWGLQNPSSRHGARNRILNTIDGLGGVDNVLLIFGEVDVRFHSMRYFHPNGDVNMPALLQLVGSYRSFIDSELIYSGRVRKNVFVYYGYRYARATTDHFGPDETSRLNTLHSAIERLIPIVMQSVTTNASLGTVIVPIIAGVRIIEDARMMSESFTLKEHYMMSASQPASEVHFGGHLYTDIVLPTLNTQLNGWNEE